MNYDLYKKLYEKNAEFFKARPVLIKALPWADKVVSGFFFVAYATLCLYIIMQKVSVDAYMGVFFPPLLCLLMVSVLRIAVERPRPYTEQGANVTPLVEKKRGDMQSFPSRHVASAVVIASVFSPFFPTVAWGLYFLSAVLAYLRFSMGFHYPSDLLAGGLIGLFAGFILSLF